MSSYLINGLRVLAAAVGLAAGFPLEALAQEPVEPMPAAELAAADPLAVAPEEMDFLAGDPYSLNEYAQLDAAPRG
ncbi:MAG: hypothetical protein EHM42_06005, partial [Planctomycetaceae bacterium]